MADFNVADIVVYLKYELYEDSTNLPAATPSQIT